jgi:hypothetical protein
MLVLNMITPAGVPTVVETGWSFSSGDWCVCEELEGLYPFGTKDRILAGTHDSEREAIRELLLLGWTFQPGVAIPSLGNLEDWGWLNPDWV